MNPAAVVLLSGGVIVREGIALDVEYALTLSCYDPSEDGLA